MLHSAVCSARAEMLCITSASADGEVEEGLIRFTHGMPVPNKIGSGF